MAAMDLMYPPYAERPATGGRSGATAFLEQAAEQTVVLPVVRDIDPRSRPAQINQAALDLADTDVFDAPIDWALLVRVRDGLRRL